MFENNKQERRAVITRLALVSILLALSSPSLYISHVSLKTHIDQSPIEDKPQAKREYNAVQEPLHILYGLSGNASGFLSEFEISMKSVLMNSPVDSDMTIHVIADNDAYRALPNVLNQTGVSTWKTRNRISVAIYNIESKLQKWSNYLNKKTGYKLSAMVDVHTIGAYFRLFVDDVVDASKVPHVLYLDTDVVVMSPLDALWKLRDDKAYFQFGTLECSGFLIINVAKINNLWELIEHLGHENLRRYSRLLRESLGDQLFLRVLNATNPEVVSLLPPEWDVHLTNLWKGSLFNHRPNGVGYEHLNGGGRSKESAFLVSQFLPPKMEQRGWTLANYFIKIPWSWAKFHVESLVTTPPGHELVVEWKTVESNVDQLVSTPLSHPPSKASASSGRLPEQL